MNKELTLTTINYFDKAYDAADFEADYAYFSEMVLDEIKLKARRTDIPVEYASLVAELIGIRMVLAKTQEITPGTITSTSVTTGEIKAITEGDTRTEFTTSADSKINASSGNNSVNGIYEAKMEQLVLRIRKLVW